MEEAGRSNALLEGPASHLVGLDAAVAALDALEFGQMLETAAPIHFTIHIQLRSQTGVILLQGSILLVQ